MTRSKEKQTEQVEKWYVRFNNIYLWMAMAICVYVCVCDGSIHTYTIDRNFHWIAKILPHTFMYVHSE